MLPINSFTVADAEDEESVGNLGVDDAVVSDAVFEEALEFSAERLASMGMVGELALELI